MGGRLSNLFCSSPRQFLPSQPLKRPKSLFGQPFKFERVDDSFRWENFVDHAMESIFIAVLVFMDVSPHASASRFKFFESHCESSRSEPLSVELRVCVSFEDELARCVELSCNEELLLARFGSNFRLTHFFSPPFESFFFSASNSLSKAS